MKISEVERVAHPIKKYTTIKKCHSAASYIIITLVLFQTANEFLKIEGIKIFLIKGLNFSEEDRPRRRKKAVKKRSNFSPK